MELQFNAIKGYNSIAVEFLGDDIRSDSLSNTIKIYATDSSTLFYVEVLFIFAFVFIFGSFEILFASNSLPEKI